MIVELHIIQNFAPSNLNRDASNAPKDCKFGGYRRARISSQCIKRSVRRHPAFADAVKAVGGDVGIRTQRLKKRLVEIFVEKHSKPSEEAGKAASAIIDLLGLKMSETEKTEYLLYLGEGEVMDMANIALSAWDGVTALEIGKEKKKKDAPPEALKQAQDALKSVVAKARKEVRSYAADIALFGRMVADNKNMNVDAACQVAHALSTHKVEMEMDYFTAIDDISGEEPGAGMIDVVEFNSSCFYRYSAIDLNKLNENLGSNSDLLNATVKGYIDASVKAVPTGKQNSMAAQNPPAYVRVLVRKDGFPWSLANAFQKPVYASRENGSLEEVSIAELEKYLTRLKSVYGEGSIVCDAQFNLYSAKTGSLKQLLEAVNASLSKEATA